MVKVLGRAPVCHYDRPKVDVGLYITKPLFTHGQLYVGLSRARNPNKIFIESHLDTENMIDNIVWKEILEN